MSRLKRDFLFLVLCLILAGLAVILWPGEGQPSIEPKLDPSMEITIERWFNEAWLNVTYLSTSDFSTPVFDDNKKTWTSTDEDVNYYVKMGKDHDFIEYEIILKSPPKSNIFSFIIETDGLVFYYQPPLDQDIQYPKGYTVNATHAIDQDGNIQDYRPLDVVGSYAIYHESLRDNEYQTGKFGHIYRPLVTDALGSKIWGELAIVDELMTIEVDQAYLDTAVYPVVVDPTFGWTSMGGSSITLDEIIIGALLQAPQDGIIKSIYLGLSAWGANEQVMAGLYFNETLALMDYSLENTSGGGFGFHEFPLIGSDQVLTAGEFYILCGWGDDVMYIRYDSSARNNIMKRDPNAYTPPNPSWPNPLVVNNEYDRLASIYGEYELIEAGTGLGLVNYNTTDASEPVLIKLNASDVDGLSGYILSVNSSGAWVNGTWTSLGDATGADFNGTFMLPGQGEIMGLRPFLNDSLGNWYVGPVILFPVATPTITPPPQTNDLGEVVDNYEDTSMVNASNNVNHNPTLDTMELGNQSVREDFTGYTEVDGDGDLTVNMYNITWTTMRRDSDDYVYYDFGAGFFSDFEHNFTVTISDLEAGDASTATLASVWTVTNTIGTQDEWEHGDVIALMIVENGAVDDQYTYLLLQYSGGVPNDILEFSAVYNLATHYITVIKSGTRVDAYIYSDEARLNLLESIGDNGDDDSYRYFQPIASPGKDNDNADHSTGYVKDVYLGFAEGYFTTTNFLAGLNNDALVALFNTSQSGGTINVEWSPDWLAWTDLGTISDNTDSLDLRGFESQDTILRFNFTGGPGSTVSLYQTRVLYDGPFTLGNLSGSWVEYNFTSIETLIGTNSSTGGNWLNQTYWLDGYEYNVTEVVGAPGYDIRFNVTGLPDGLICIQIVGYMQYDGSAGHIFNVQAYNYSSSSWVIVSDIPDASKAWINGTIDCLPDDFIQGGLFQGRYYHTSPGNVNHDWCLDYGKFRAFAPTPIPVTPTPTPTVSGVTYLTYALAIILLLFGLMIGSRVRR